MRLHPIHHSVTSAAVCFALMVLHNASAQEQPQREVIRVPLPAAAVTVGTDGESGRAVFTGKDIALVGQAGAPALPVLSFKVLLPPNANLKSVTATLENVTEHVLPEQHDVAPMPPVISRGVPLLPKGVELKDGRSNIAYARDEYTPNRFIGLVLPGQMREWRFVEIEFKPYRYNPVSKKLRKLTAGQLAVAFSRNPEERIMRTRSKRIADLIEQNIKRSVVNFPEASPAYRVARRIQDAE